VSRDGMAGRRQGVEPWTGVDKLICCAAFLLTPVVVFSALFFFAIKKLDPPQDQSTTQTASTPRPFVAAKPPPPSAPAARQVSGDPAPAAVSPPLPQDQRCAPAARGQRIEVVNDENVGVFARPNRTPVEKANGEPLVIDPRYELEVAESRGDWVRVKIRTPDWTAGSPQASGWIERRFVQRATNADEKNCLFVDFGLWTSVAQETRNSMREIALRVLKEDRRCARIARGGFIGQGQRLFLTCYPTDGGRPYHYWFSTGDRVANQSFVQPRPATQTEAVESCRAALKTAVARSDKIAGRTPQAMAVLTASASVRDGVHYVAFTAGKANSARQVARAYCLQPPGGEPEITLQ
jgi:hypothetical protein